MQHKAMQQRIMQELEVVTDFDPAREIRRRIDFLAGYLQQTGTAGYVLGISGGVDSTLAGRLAQLACEEVRARGGDATFVAMRLPYQVQADESDAQDAVAFIDPDEFLTVNIGAAADAMWQAVTAAAADTAGYTDFVRGNVKARERMIAQFAVAGARRMLVIGTDQAAESLVGFFTKFGDGAADLTPLTGLTKGQVRAAARQLGCPEHLVEKVPTADLEADKPLQPDEVALGVSYADIDAYLTGADVSDAAEETILGWYRRTAHKRALPLTPGQWEAAQS
ncbi:MAG: ammonia-dependent NAD(+) synthetase [Trueperella sp.]|nr:ammonia-dependent NAD(+) synthetase [Trueperella sp.]